MGVEGAALGAAQPHSGAALEDALGAYRKLQAGELSARAVVVPHGW